MVDISKTNFQPLIDLLSKAGEETTEYKHAKSSGLMAQIAFWLGLVILIGSAVVQMFGPDDKIGMIAGMVVTVVGVIAKIVSSNAYTTARTDTKAEASTVAQAVINASPLATDTVTPFAYDVPVAQPVLPESQRLAVLSGGLGGAQQSATKP